MDKLRLEPTAALVMQWSLKLYKEEPVLRFINQLDLSSGKNLYDKCHSVCDWYDEVILNRKSFIKHLIDQELSIAKQEHQLVFLAAGKSPLSIEILLRHTSKVHRIFEIDISGMQEKQKLYSGLYPEFLGKIQCIDADITSPDFLDILDRLQIGFRHDIPTIILMEGMSYYLRRYELKNIIVNFRGEADSIFIVEYLVPLQRVIRSRRFIPGDIFKIIQKDCGLDGITSYTKEELMELFQEIGGNLINSYSMADMELVRTGANTYFKKPNDGWIECIVSKVGTHNVLKHTYENSFLENAI